MFTEIDFTLNISVEECKSIWCFSVRSVMTPEQIQLLLDLQFRQTIALEKISLALEKLTPTDAPNYEYPLESFSNFDWGSISRPAGKNRSPLKWRVARQPLLTSFPSKSLVEAVPARRAGTRLARTRLQRTVFLCPCT